MALARVIPSRSERCWTAVVKNEDDDTSSQRSKLEKCVPSAGAARNVSQNKRCLIPVIGNIVKVEFNDWPKSVGYV